MSGPARTGFTPGQYLICLRGIMWREALRFLQQRERFVSALVRPLVWLFIFAAGFRQVLGISIIPPYETYVLYEDYVTPGLIAMIQLFNGMQSSLSMVYDREMGNMRMLLVSPFPRWFLLVSKLLASTAVSILQVAAFGLVAWLWGVEMPPWAGLAVLPALVLCGLMLGSLGMLLSSVIKQLENFSGVMNFVIFPMLFASSALYPLWLVQQSSPVVYFICKINPFTYGIELIRFALYGRLNLMAFLVVAGVTSVFMIGAILAYDPARGLLVRRGGGASMRAMFAVMALLVLGETAWAAPPLRAGAGRDSDWPCQQVKVSELSVGAFWAGPEVDPASSGWRENPAVAALVGQIVQRRMKMEQATQLVMAFAAKAGPQASRDLTELFAGVFTVLNHERGQVMNGLSRFGQRQKALAEQLRQVAEALRAAQSAEPQDQAKIDDLTRRLLWDQQVFQSRRESLSRACEVPTAIEQRLFAVAKLIEKLVE